LPLKSVNTALCVILLTLAGCTAFFISGEDNTVTIRADKSLISIASQVKAPEAGAVVLEDKAKQPKKKLEDKAKQPKKKPNPGPH